MLMKHVMYISIVLLLISCKTNSQKMTDNKSENIVSTSSSPSFKVLAKGDTLHYINKTAEEWSKELNKQEFYVIRKKGTERSFTGEYWDNKKEGIYSCRACALPLFDSKTKYKSGTGWPSFWQPIEDDYIREDTDYDLGYARTEVMCERCGGHLGHVFPDGPKPTGLRYCINSVSLNFEEKK